MFFSKAIYFGAKSTPECPGCELKLVIIPPARQLFEEALDLDPNADLNSLHRNANERMIVSRNSYYTEEVGNFLLNIDISPDVKNKIRDALLKPIDFEGREYSNIIEKIAIRVHQSIQSTTGNISKLCSQHELSRAGLKKGLQFKVKRGDIFLYYPDITRPEKIHRVEVKSIKLKERAVRSLLGRGVASLVGFFTDPSEFTEDTIEIIDEECEESDGYFYIPPQTLEGIENPSGRIRANTRFGQDMLMFVRNGKIPD